MSNNLQQTSCLKMEGKMIMVKYLYLCIAMLTSLLEQFGFSEKEAKVYLSCLELWHAPVSSIARNIGENRVTTYSILKNLAAKWIAQTTIKNKSTYYSVISPDKFLQNYQSKVSAFEEKLPEFMAIANKFDNKPKVKFFEWVEGLKKIYEDELESEKETISAFLWVEEVSPKLLDYLNLHFLPQRIKMNIHAKVLLCHQDKKDNYSVYNSSKKLLTEYKVLNFDFVKFFNEINIYGNDKVAVMMFSEDEMSGLIIQSKKFHDTMKSIFDLVWFVADTTWIQKTQQNAKPKSSLPKKEKKSSKESSSKKS